MSIESSLRFGYPSANHQDDKLTPWINLLEKPLEIDFLDYKPPLPLTRIKKIMKSDEDVRMISHDAPFVFAKACEAFILDLTQCAFNAAHNKKSLTKNDIAHAISKNDFFDFLNDLVTVEGEATPAAPSTSSLQKGDGAFRRPMVNPLREDSVVKGKHDLEMSESKVKVESPNRKRLHSEIDQHGAPSGPPAQVARQGEREEDPTFFSHSPSFASNAEGVAPEHMSLAGDIDEEGGIERKPFSPTSGDNGNKLLE